MSKFSAVSREDRQYIKDQIFEMGEVSVEEVAAIVRERYLFDPIASHERDVLNYFRRLLASVRNADGTRIVLAVEGQPGRFVNVEICDDPYLLEKIDNQVDKKWKGISRTRDKIKKRRAEVRGQLSLYEEQLPTPAVQSVVESL